MTTLPAIQPGYNERSWAIDVISEINGYLRSRRRPIRRAGGENTIKNETSVMFPDVLLYGDDDGGMILQGWELKMPDTPITDSELLDNATAKALRLKLNSFLVWNVNQAVLYRLEGDGSFQARKTWPRIGLLKREEVKANKATWIALLHTIIDDLNDMFEVGSVSGAAPSIALSDVLFTDFLNIYQGRFSEELITSARKSATFSAEIDEWWLINGKEHPGETSFQALAKVNIINWINRFIFAHYLKKYHSESRIIDSISTDTTITEAILIFDQISKTCDFLNVFRPALGQDCIDNMTWSGLTQLNNFLININLDNISQQGFHQIMEKSLSYSRKKLAGQFSTPKPLAELLVQIGIEDRTGNIIDPCCGTGTIARAVYDLKRQIGLEIEAALGSVWASDKFLFPLQLCSIALSDPLGMGEVVQVFQKDAFALRPGDGIVFTNPSIGSDVVRTIPLMHAVVSNLPFVRFEDIEKVNPGMSKIAKSTLAGINSTNPLSGRTDLYAYLALNLRHFVQPSGRVAIITTNSWLGTDWGAAFRDILQQYFRILRVIISSEGRWFENADVVTTIIVMEKRNSPAAPESNEAVDFVTINIPIEDWTESDNMSKMVNAIILQSSSTSVTKNTYLQSTIGNLESYGLGWSSYFTDLTWMDEIKKCLIPVSSLFDIRRGERRGWDDLFYPSKGHNIEPEFLKPVLLSSREINSLVTKAESEAFCCSESIESLTLANKSGALVWISRFEKLTNGTGTPLPKVLAKSNEKWYEMSAQTLADLVIPMNPDKRLFVARLEQPSFVNQRLIRLTKKNNSVELDICHALLNSIIGMLFIEASGFGRGLGALDLNATKLKQNLHMLDPNLLGDLDKQKILSAFKPLTERNSYNLPEELNSKDRQHFDSVVLSIFGVEHLLPKIDGSLRALYKIRQTARHN